MRQGLTGGLILFIGAGLVVWGGLEMSRATASKRWPSISGTVLRAELLEIKHHNEESGESRFYPQITYGYTVSGETYTANRLAFGGYPGTTRVEAQNIVDRYPAGRSIVVYHDPNHPAMAVLDNGYSRMAEAMLGAGWVIIGVGIFVVRRWNRRQQRAGLHSGI